MTDQKTPRGPDGPSGIEPISIIEEMQRSYLDYAMSVIVSRALPDVRDGLKPVHRRILYAAHESGYHWNRKYVKSARPVADVMGKYHPHGDASIYDALVRMAQDWSMRVPLIDGQGNFGSIDGDPPAAMRYTEARLTKVAHELLEDIDKETVDFQENYDASAEEPKVLPARFPNLLVNGSGGIAVGMATNIPPHNLGEVVDGAIALIDNPAVELAELMEIIPGPDFPTGGIILGRSGISFRLFDGARLDPDARQGGHRDDPRRPRGDHHHRGALPGQQSHDDREDGRAGARKAHRRHLRHPRRERPAGLPGGDRAAAGRRSPTSSSTSCTASRRCRPPSAPTWSR